MPAIQTPKPIGGVNSTDRPKALMVSTLCRHFASQDAPKNLKACASIHRPARLTKTNIAVVTKPQPCQNGFHRYYAAECTVVSVHTFASSGVRRLTSSGLRARLAQGRRNAGPGLRSLKPRYRLMIRFFSSPLLQFSRDVG